MNDIRNICQSFVVMQDGAQYEEDGSVAFQVSLLCSLYSLLCFPWP